MTVPRQILFESPGKAVLRELPARSPGPEEVLIETEVSLVSAGTERSMLLHAPAYPVLPGYSAVGTIVAIGERVKDFRPGDRVVATVAHASHAIVHETFVARVPEGLASEHAAFFNLGAMAIYCLRLAEITLGDPVVILGQGLIGLLTTQIARQGGAVPVIALDIDRAKLELASAMGADHVFHANEDRDALRTVLDQLPGKGAAATIELTGAAGPIDQAIELTRRQGRVVAASLVMQGHLVDIYGRVFLEGLKLIGAYFNARPFQLRTTDVTSPLDWPVRPFDAGVYDENAISTSAGDVALFLRLANFGRLELATLLDEEVSADDAVAMFEQLPQSHSLGRLIRWKQPGG